MSPLAKYFTKINLLETKQQAAGWLQGRAIIYRGNGAAALLVARRGKGEWGQGGKEMRPQKVMPLCWPALEKTKHFQKY